MASAVYSVRLESVRVSVENVSGLVIQSFVESSHSFKSITETIVSFSEVSFGLHGLAKMLNRLGGFAMFEKLYAEIKVRIGIIGVNPQRPAVIFDSVTVSAL